MDVVERIKKKLDAHIGVGITALERHYESDWKAIFDEAARAGVVTTPDLIENELNERWPEAMKDQRYTQLLNRVKQLWDQWNKTG